MRDATTLPGLEVELAVMTGNVAQVFLTDRAWTAALRGTRAALKDAGHLVFETRRPERRVWEEWPLRTEPVTRDVPGVGVVERRLQITAVALPLVSFRYTYSFARDGDVVTSDSTLRFRSAEEVDRSLTENGFRTVEVREATDEQLSIPGVPRALEVAMSG